MRRHLLSRSSVVGLIAAAILAPAMAAAQGSASIAGTVTDSASGAPLTSVQVLVVGTTRGGFTDEAGRFTIRGLSGGPLTLRAQRIGYRPVTRSLSLAEGEAATANFALTEAARILTEMVVTGYSTDTRATVSNAVTKVEGSVIQNKPVAGVDAALQGKAPGVQVTQNAGNPGAGITVRIRGSSSLSASNQPLYVVDGMPVIREDFSQLDLGGQDITAVTALNPDDIEDITVLKDAAAAAIYGSRGSNGVIVITTKRGRSGAGRVQFSGYTGMQNIAHKVQMLNATQYLEYMNEAVLNDSLYEEQNFGGTDYTSNYFGTVGVTDVATHTDWQDEVFRSAPVSNANMSIAGGTDRVQYFVSGSAFDQRGIAIGSSYVRQSARVNLDFNATSKLKLKTSVDLSHEDHGRIEGDNTIDGVVTNAIALQPYLPSHNPDGTFTSPNDGLEYSNPLALAKYNSAHTKTLRAIGNVEATYNIFRDLAFTTRLGADILDLRDLNWNSPNVGGTYAVGAVGVGTQTATTANRYVLESFMNYVLPATGASSLTTTLGASAEWNGAEQNYLRGEGFGNEVFRYPGNASRITVYDGGWSGANLSSFFARANYSFAEKYLATASIRTDGSSRFGANNRYGTFPAVSIGWVPTKEGFLAPLAQWVDLKLRASTGLTGNQAISSDFAPLERYGKANYGDVVGIAQVSLANPDLRWESTREIDGGFDLSAMQGRVTLIGDWYHKKTSDLLVLRPISTTSGLSSVWQNVGNIENKGVEAQVTTRNWVSESAHGFNWTTDFNISHNANKVTKLYLSQPFTSGIRGVNRVEEGLPLGAFYTLVFDGVDPATGDAKYKDLNGDGQVNSDDRTIVGSPHPKYTGGMRNDFSWMGLSLGSFFQFNKGNQIYNAMGIFSNDGGYYNDNKQVTVMSRWQKPGDITNQPRASYDGTSNARQVSSRYIEDGSYIRLQELRLAYELPGRWAGLSRMHDARVYVAGTNLKTWTNYTGYTPDVNSLGSGANISLGTDFYAYPVARAVTFGISGTF